MGLLCLLLQVQDREESLVLPETAILNTERCSDCTAYADGQFIAVM